MVERISKGDLCNAYPLKGYTVGEPGFRATERCLYFQDEEL